MTILNRYYYPPVNFWSVWFSEIVLRSLQKNNSKINKSDNLLDVGCGLGNHCFSMREFNPSSITGFDISNETIELLKTFPGNIEFKKIDICKDNISAFKSKFNVLFSCDVYEHVKDPQIMLNHLYFVLADNGVLSITFPNFDDHGHNQIKSVSELSEKIKLAGFKDHKIDIIKDRTIPYKIFTWFYILLQNFSDWIYGINRNAYNRMPESDEFHEMYAFKKIYKLKDKRFLIFIINLTYSILKKIGRLSSVYTIEDDQKNIKNMRVVFWAKK